MCHDGFRGMKRCWSACPKEWCGTTLSGSVMFPSWRNSKITFLIATLHILASISECTFYNWPPFLFRITITPSTVFLNCNYCNTNSSLAYKFWYCSSMLYGTIRDFFHTLSSGMFHWTSEGIWMSQPPRHMSKCVTACFLCPKCTCINQVHDVLTVDVIEANPKRICD